MTVRFLQKEQAVWGPIFLLCALALSLKTSVPLDLLATAAAGFFLCVRWRKKGLVYSFVLLAVFSLIKHAFLIEDHLWQLGLDVSLALSFSITALAFEETASFHESLESQVQTRKANLENLEEEIKRLQEASQAQQIASQEKGMALQKELEELQSEHSSILVLNEVLRKTTARKIEEMEFLRGQASDLQREKKILRAEYEECQNDLNRLASTDAMALQNSELMEELNRERCEKEQIHFMNETLTRLHMKEFLKAREADQEAGQMADLLSSAKKEILRLEERVPVKDDALLKQLRKQFEEKSEVLHQTRAELFRSDTALETLQREKMALELSPIPKELGEMEERLEVLEEENQQLQELVSMLMESSSDALPRKKKVKIQSSPDQTLLF